MVIPKVTIPVKPLIHAHFPIQEAISPRILNSWSEQSLGLSVQAHTLG